MFKEFDTFDVAIALYHWLQHNWEGQADELYSDFCVLTAPGMLKVSPHEQTFEHIGEMEREIYEMLSRENYKEALEMVINYKPID